MHPLSGKLAEHWAVWVNGNWCVTSRFIDGDVELALVESVRDPRFDDGWSGDSRARGLGIE